MRVRIKEIIQLSPLVKEFRLSPVEDNTIPAWKPGAHIELTFCSRSGTQFRNAYSIMGEHEGCLRIAVQREENGRGGSRLLHDEFHTGMEMELSGPIDAFELHPATTRNVLIAGGIGITPILSMASALDASGNDFELHYLARDRSGFLFLDELTQLSRGKIFTYVTEVCRPDIAALIGLYSDQSELHACGPVSLMEAVNTTAASLNWPACHLHFESFGARKSGTDRPLRVHLRQSGMTLEVVPGTSILDAMIAADAFVSYECKRGECGNCYSPVISGKPLHRDICLTPAQRAEGMATCVSWAAGPELELDM